MFSLNTPPPGEPFDLHRGKAITDPVKFWQSLRADIDDGPGIRRDHAGAIRADLVRLWKMFGPGTTPALDQ